MVSPEILRRYQFFAGLSDAQIGTLAPLADEIAVKADQYLFREGDDLNTLYVVEEGKIAITLNLPEITSRSIIPAVGARTREATASLVGPGDVFAWSSLVPPFKATSNGKAATRCKVVALDSRAIRQLFEQDPRFGYQMLLKVAQVARDRLQDLHYESLAQSVGA